MRSTAHGTLEYRRRRLGELVAMSLLGALLVSSLVAVSPPDAGAAVPAGAPPNPTQPCTWNWNRWSIPGNFTFPYDDSSFDPTQAVFSQANGWYQASSGPTASYSGLREGAGPAEITTGANDSEWSYGVGYYVMAPGARRTITISDSSRQESHAFAFFNSAGEQFARYPSSGYVASETEPKSNPGQAGAVSRGNSWSASVTITAPSDGKVYIHYLNFDERLRTQFATFDGACGPSLVADTSSDNVPGSAVTVDVTANDTNVTRSSVSIVGADATGRVAVEGEGAWSVDSEGSISFRPEREFTGSPAPIRYTAADNRGREAAPVTFTVGYAPTFVEDDASLANEAFSTVDVDVVANDSFIVPRSISLVGANSSGRIVVPNAGAWSVNSGTGTISFTPESDYEDDPSPVRYIAQDSRGNIVDPATVRVTYAPNIEPDESLLNFPADSAWIDVLENDPSTNIDPTTVQIVGANSEGELVVTDEGTWSVDPITGAVTFDPEPGFGSDPQPVMYTVADVGGDFAEPAQIVVDYTPILRRDESSGNPAGGIITIDVLANDPSNDLNPTTVAIDHPNYNATTRTLFVENEGTWSVDAVTGAITYIPEVGNVTEPTPINYTVRDEEDSVSAPAEFSIRYLPLPATTRDTSNRNRLGLAATVNVLRNDTGPELEADSVEMVIGGTTTRELVVEDEGSWRVDPVTGAITFTPERGFEGNPAPVEYVATDNLGVSTRPTSVTVTYIGAVEALAFADGPPVAPMQDRASLVGLGLLALLMFAACAALSSGIRWRRPRRNPVEFFFS